MDYRDQDLIQIGGIVSQCDNIPIALREQAIWLTWRLETVNGRVTKVPYNARTGRKASSNDSATWCSFDAAHSALKNGGYNGLGIGISGGIAAIDIDHCVDRYGNLSDMAKDIVERMDCYTEYSPSGTGLRLIFTAPGFQYDKARYYINNQKAGLEVYIAGCTNKYVTITGKVMSEQPVADRAEQVKGVLEAYMKRPEMPKPEPKKTRDTARAPQQPRTFGCNAGGTSTLADEEVLRRAALAANGGDFKALWDGGAANMESRSEADLALCSHLAFWTRGDAAQIDRLFRQSALYRDKWEREDYRAATIQKAISGCANFYEPKPNEPNTPAQREGAQYTKISELHPEKNRRYRWTDVGSARLFADVYKSSARYVPERKKWFVFTGKRWEPDLEALHVMNLATRLADSLLLYSLSIKDEELRSKYTEYAGKWQARGFRERILKDAAAIHPVPLARFDAQPMLLNCLNGTLDLKTRSFHEHRPEDMLSLIANVIYEPEAQSERWERFILEIMQDDLSKAAFLQKALGYALTGDTSHECFFVLYGPTSRNGKGTCMETYLLLMGGYGKTARPDTITQKQSPNGGGGPSEDIARLAGARFVNISEPDKKMVLSAALVKTLTGNDTIIARNLHENSFEYKPQFKLFVNTNYLPQVTDVTLFGSGRVKVIPFERHFGEHERDRDLKADLAKPENLSGILNWCLEGLWLIDELGFDAPPSVLAATQAYRMDSDKFARFLADEFEEDPNAETQLSTAYAQFQLWCADNGFQAENSKNFKAGLGASVKIKKKRLAGMSSYQSPVMAIIGYRLIPRNTHNGGGIYT